MSPRVVALTHRNRDTRELEYIEILTHPPQSKIIVESTSAREGDIDITLSDPNGSRTVTMNRAALKVVRDVADELLDVMPRDEHDTVDRDGNGDRMFVTIENYSDLNMLELASGMEIRFGEFGGRLLETINLQPRARAKLVHTADGWRRERIIR